VNDRINGGDQFVHDVWIEDRALMEAKARGSLKMIDVAKRAGGEIVQKSDRVAAA
jgi:hypothetical protein